MINSKKILFVCPFNQHPSGGVKQIYRMVDVLNANGVEAYVVHETKNQRETWFPNQTKIAYSYYIFKLLKWMYKSKWSTFEKLKLKYYKKKSTLINEDTILVFPEIYGSVHKIEPDIKKVIFNQNCYYTFNNFTYQNVVSDFPYNQNNTLATIVVSEDSQQYLQKTFGKNIYRIRLGINHNIFRYSNQKEKIIAFMPRKLADDIHQVICIFKARNPNSDWKFVAIENKSEPEVAEIFQKSSIFLSFNHKEGFGLPPVEAMACGCYTIGYKGQAGKEYFIPDFTDAVNEGEIIHFVEKIENAIFQFENNPKEMQLKCKMASDFVYENYNYQIEEKDTMEVWQKILSAL